MYYLISNDWIHQIFRKRRKKLSFVIKDDDVLDKYNKIWDKIKETLSIDGPSKTLVCFVYFDNF